MAGSPSLDEVLAAAHAQVRAIDWTTWQPMPGDARIAEHLFGPQPELTTVLLNGYLSTCGWIWNRPVRPDEGQRVAAALASLWLDRGAALDFAPLVDVLSIAWLPGTLQRLPPDRQEALREQLLAQVPDGRFPGVDVPVPGAAAAAAAERAALPPSTLTSPGGTGVALDGLFQSTNFGLQLNIYGPPGSGTWGSTTEFYAFFPDGSYLYFPSGNEVGARLQDPRAQPRVRRPLRGHRGHASSLRRCERRNARVGLRGIGRPAPTVVLRQAVHLDRRYVGHALTAQAAGRRPISNADLENL